MTLRLDPLLQRAIKVVKFVENRQNRESRRSFSKNIAALIKIKFHHLAHYDGQSERRDKIINLIKMLCEREKQKR